MAADPRKRQKKLAKHSAKRKAKHQTLVRAKSAGLPERMAAAARYPILDCLVTTALWDQGMGWVLMSRELPDGIAVAIFLIDRYCLGVKNVIVRIASHYQYANDILQHLKSKFPSRAIKPATARHFVESAVAYGRSLGFEPPVDYARAQLIFGDLDPAAATEHLEFGKDGKPLFIAGPNDDEARCRQILATMQRTVGDAAEIIIPLPSGHRDAPWLEGDDEEWDEL